MESIIMQNLDSNFWKNKKVLLTGHTGFKGTWASVLLFKLGAKVYGLSLEDNTDCTFYNEANISKKFQVTKNIDINDLHHLEKFFKAVNPDVILHFAAQPLVLESYRNPIETFKTNVIGTANIFEAARNLNFLKSIICVTSDKCYKNNEQVWPYREIDPLGGIDPYSASKSCAEIVAASYWNSFFNKSEIKISTVRSGNVIGGGDYSKNRILTDINNCINENKTLQLRNPNATRPWQHVIEPIYGYLSLVENHFSNKVKNFDSFNFGPELGSYKSVYELCMETSNAWGTKLKIEIEKDNKYHESQKLSLDSSKVKDAINWRPRWNFNQTVTKTVKWYKNILDGKNAYDLCLNDIETYEENISG
tara:strand:+ start:1033 stop:2121 length:1089 start_codon:yes stop_codon:yes gene_type:complete